MLEKYVGFGSILPNVKNKIGRKMTKTIESELLDGLLSTVWGEKLLISPPFCYSNGSSSLLNIVIVSADG